MSKKIDEHFFNFKIEYIDEIATLHFYYENLYTGLSVISAGPYIIGCDLSLFNNQEYIGKFSLTGDSHKKVWKILTKRRK